MKRKKKKLDKMTSLYLITAVFVAVLSVFSFTFAWYVKTSTQYLNIQFAPPIVVSIKNEIVLRQTITGENEVLIPGSSFGVNLGIYMEENSSSAYVRVKMAVVFENVYDENNQLLLWDNMVVVNNSINEDYWIEVNFGTAQNPDWWYVCKRSSGNQIISREINPKDEITFANGTVTLTEKIDNNFANKKIEVVMIVETLQTVGVKDPLSNGLANAYKHEIWGIGDK